VKNPRVARQVRAAQQLADRDELQATAVAIKGKLQKGLL
jgi:hypothetical protein